MNSILSIDIRYPKLNYWQNHLKIFKTFCPEDVPMFRLIFVRRELLTLNDGGVVALDWSEDNCYPTSPIVIIVPGLTGSSQADYLRCILTASKNVGIRCVVFNNRGLGGIPLKVRLQCSKLIKIDWIIFKVLSERKFCLGFLIWNQV